MYTIVELKSDSKARFSANYGMAGRPTPVGCFVSCYGIGSPDSDGHGRLLKQFGSAGLEASTGLPDDSFPGDWPQGFSSQAWAVNVSPSGCNSRPFPLSIYGKQVTSVVHTGPYSKCRRVGHGVSRSHTHKPW
jgi:hypothetical protein